MLGYIYYIDDKTGRHCIDNVYSLHPSLHIIHPMFFCLGSISFIIVESTVVTENTTTPKRRGRPPKKAVAEKKVGNRVGRGRPKGDAAIINEYKARMLASPKSVKVLEKIFDAALDDEHKHQAAAWKLVMDRVAPTAAFEKDVVKGAGRNAIQINITGVGGETQIIGGNEEDVVDGEYYED